MPRQNEEDKPENYACEHCDKHQAAMWWIGEGGDLAISRYYMQNAWCECCALDAQIEYAEERAKALADLKKRRSEVVCVEVDLWPCDDEICLMNVGKAHFTTECPEPR